MEGLLGIVSQVVEELARGKLGRAGYPVQVVKGSLVTVDGVDKLVGLPGHEAGRRVAENVLILDAAEPAEEMGLGFAQPPNGNEALHLRIGVRKPLRRPGPWRRSRAAKVAHGTTAEAREGGRSEVGRIGELNTSEGRGEAGRS